MVTFKCLTASRSHKRSTACVLIAHSRALARFSHGLAHCRIHVNAAELDVDACVLQVHRRRSFPSSFLRVSVVIVHVSLIGFQFRPIRGVRYLTDLGFDVAPPAHGAGVFVGHLLGFWVGVELKLDEKLKVCNQVQVSPKYLSISGLGDDG